MALGRIGAPAVEPLLRELEIAHAEGDALLRHWLLYALLSIRDHRLVAPLLQLLPQIDEYGRRDIVQALALIGGRDVLPPLWERLDEEPSSGVRKAILQALSAIDAAGSFDKLLGALRDPSREVREEALGQLGQLRDTRAVPALLRLLRGQRDWQVAATALTQINGQAIPPLIEGLWWPEPNARQHAARALISVCYSASAVTALKAGGLPNETLLRLQTMRADPDEHVILAVKMLLQILEPPPGTGEEVEGNER